MLCYCFGVTVLAKSSNRREMERKIRLCCPSRDHEPPQQSSQSNKIRVGKSSADINEIISKNATTVDAGTNAIRKVHETLAKIDSEINQLSDHVEVIDAAA